ncbi:hypothetical protein OKW43_008197 [Paraburkholderia sp. WC7.3g]
MQTHFPETVGQLAECWTVLINETSRESPGHYPDTLCREVMHLIRHTERVIESDVSEQDQDLIADSSRLAEKGDLKAALFKLHEVISARMIE